MERYLKHFALVVGILLLVASMIFSYQGFAFNFQTAGGNWKVIFFIIGMTMTASVAVLQLVFNTDYSHLNLTLKIFGVLSYVYSIYTNYRGLSPFVGIDGDDVTTWIIAVFLDAVPEPLIAWSLGEALKGDLLGNIIKWVLPRSPVNQPQSRHQNNKPAYQGAGQGNQVPQRQRERERAMFESISPRFPKKMPNPQDAKFIHPSDEPTYHPVSYKYEPNEFEE